MEKLMELAVGQLWLHHDHRFPVTIERVHSSGFVDVRHTEYGWISSFFRSDFGSAQGFSLVRIK
jgi:alpha-D-ribose 1-methylphosphonate 5-triphosphate synthase subunit PhnL